MSKPIPQEIEAQDDVQDIEYSEDEAKFRNKLIQEAVKARSQRETLWPELDDMTYEQSYVSNAKATNGYIPPKINQEDVRTVSGTTREKSNALVSAFLNYNLEPSVIAFDEDDMPLIELGKTMEDLIKKSRKLEAPLYEHKRPYYIKELVDQGTVFIEEQWIEYSVMRKKLKDMPMDKILKSKWEQNLEDICKMATTDMLYGPSVYLGNMRQPYFQYQPFVFLRRELTREEAQAKYGKWERWEYVPRKIKWTVQSNTTGPTTNWGSWAMVEVSHDMVEELKYYNPWTNTFQILLNGVMMLPIGFPLEFLMGESRYPIACGKLEPIPFFAYGRGIGHKNKFNQALVDEMFKAIILKTRKSYQPPMANNTGQTLSKKIFYPATVTNNIDPEKLREIGVNQGVSQAEMAAFDLVRRVIDEGSVTSQFQGMNSGTQQTARETVELKQQQLMKLGLSIVGLINMEVDLSWLRLKNILKHWTEPMDEELSEVKGGIKKLKKYRTEAVESEFDDGMKGQRIVEFTDQQLPHPMQTGAEEKLLSEVKGVPVKKVYLSVDDLKNLTIHWFINVQPTEKDSSDLRAAIFIDNVTKFIQLFGPQAVNQEYAKKRFALLNHEDPEKFIAQGQPMQPGPAAQPDNGLSSQMQPQELPSPSLNTMLGAA